MRSLKIIAAALLAAGIPPVVVSAAAGDELLSRAAAINPNLHSFAATLHAHVVMKSFPYLSADVTGDWYYRQPDKYKVVFNGGLPIIAQQFDKLYVRLEPPSQWRQRNVVSVESADGNTTHFRLVPRQSGNVQSIEAVVDDKSATVTSMRWNYTKGAYAEMHNRYALVDGNQLVQSQTGHVEEPGYVGDITATIGDYKVNTTLPAGTFSQ
jgi:outer membrane lipoprotein-sorting protein